MQYDMNCDIVGGLLNEYSAVFSIDLKEGVCRRYSGTGLSDTVEREELGWAAAAAGLARECSPEFSELFERMGRTELLAEEFSDTDRREYLIRFPRWYRPWQRCVFRVLDRDGGRPKAVLLTLMDADDLQSEFREQQERFREQQKKLQEALFMAQSANRAKITFLNNMSHDIRTPMNAIIGYTALAVSHIDNIGQVKDYLGKIDQSSSHLLALINDVLDMSRIESGKISLEEKDENISDIIHSLRNIIQADVHAGQLDFTIDSADVYHEDVVCDRLRLNQALFNILSNAVKFTPAGGKVAMQVSEKLSEREGYGSYEFRIRDTGVGMSEDFVDTIFDPFSRVRSSTASGVWGTGLGMAITKNIVDLMGGNIEVSSELGRGTEVVMTLDFRIRSGSRKQPALPDLSGVRGLVVDDDANTCVSLARMLKDLGMRSDWCTSAIEAILRTSEAYENNDRFQLFIVDWLIPEMNGIQITRKIREVVGADVPIVILTAYDWADIEEEAYEAGVTAFARKPMFPSDLNRVLRNCFSGEEEQQREVEKETVFAGKKILLVEDNALNREIAEDILGEYGFLVDIAEDGDVAVEKIRKMTEEGQKDRYAAVLMDIQMPRMDGYTAAREIREILEPESTHMPIIAMTANAFEEDRRAALEAGMDEHIAKPIDIALLKETLRRYLEADE